MHSRRCLRDGQKPSREVDLGEAAANTHLTGPGGSIGALPRTAPLPALTPSCRFAPAQVAALASISQKPPRRPLPLAHFGPGAWALPRGWEPGNRFRYLSGAGKSAPPARLEWRGQMPWRTLGIAVLAQVESEPYEKNQDSETIKVTEMKLTEPGFRVMILFGFFDAVLDLSSD
nr:uncharacterized protein LOC107127711 isoform X6 [Macaca fascicularis]